MSSTLAFDADLTPNAANFSALTPLTFLTRTALAHPYRTAVIHGPVRRTWGETHRRCLRLASALRAMGVGPGDTVAALLPNVPEMLELHFAVPMLGAVLNTQNTRLDAASMAFMLDHGQAKVFFTDPEFHDRSREALSRCSVSPLVVDVEDPTFEGGERVGELTFDELMARGSDDLTWREPADEWQAITLNYTSGTTGDPKGVV